MPGIGKPHRSNTSVARSHDEETSDAPSAPGSLPFRKSHDRSPNEKNATLCG